MNKAIVTITMIVSLFGYANNSVQASILDEIKSAGVLTCAVTEGMSGFSTLNEEGEWSGFNVDFCKALAAGIFGDATKVEYKNTPISQLATSLEGRQSDVFMSNAAWSSQMLEQKQVSFTGITYFDGQGFMVGKSQGVQSILELSRVPVCVKMGTAAERKVEDYFLKNNIQYEIIALEEDETVIAVYEAGRCTAYAMSQSVLYAQRLKLANPEDHIILPEVISKEPHGPAVLKGDEEWFNLVQWTHFVMLNAEEIGINSVNIDDIRSANNPAYLALIGPESTLGAAFGASNDWAYNIIKQVGNYGEVFERNLGSQSPLMISRGLNRLWINGGLQYAPPIRE